MKRNFFGYIPYDDNTFEDLWENATFVLDANILLNLYRYSRNTQEQVIKCLETLIDRLWLPYNTVQEYFNNRMDIILEQENIHAEIKKKINFNSIKNEVKKIRNITLESKKEQIIKILNNCETEINNIIDIDKEESISFINKDIVLEKILKLFDGKIGTGYEQKKLEVLKKEIDKRYDNKIPPGYEDVKKTNGKRKYGDCINWFEVIDYAAKNKKDIIYITDEQKEDWILEVRNKKMGPRPELLDEFHKKTYGQKIYIYTTEGFTKNFNKYSKSKNLIKNEAIDEIRKFENDVKESIPNIGRVRSMVLDESDITNETKKLSLIQAFAIISCWLGEEIQYMIPGKSQFTNSIVDVIAPNPLTNSITVTTRDGDIVSNNVKNIVCSINDEQIYIQLYGDTLNEFRLSFTECMYNKKDYWEEALQLQQNFYQSFDDYVEES